MGVTFVTCGADGVPPARSLLFGRDEEIAEARHLLETGARLVTLTGVGGATAMMTTAWAACSSQRANGTLTARRLLNDLLGR